MSQAAVELDDEALDQVSGGLKRLDSSWKPEITEVCKLCGSTRNVRGGLDVYKRQGYCRSSVWLQRLYGNARTGGKRGKD